MALHTYAVTAAAADSRSSGWTDLYVASDFTPSLYLRNKGEGTLAEEGAERGVAFSADGAAQAGMGVAMGDYNLDGSSFAISPTAASRN